LDQDQAPPGAGVRSDSLVEINFGLLVFRQLAHFNHAAAIPIGVSRESATPISNPGTGRAVKLLL